MNRFDGIVFTRGHLLQGCGVDDHIDPYHCSPQAVDITNVADKIAQAWIVKASLPHLVLLQLIAAEDDQALRVVFPEKYLCTCVTERSGTAGYQNVLVL